MPTTGFLYYSTSDGDSTATSSGDAIIRVDSNGQNPTTIASGFTDLIEAMALDQSGNLMFVLDNTGFFAGSATGNTIWSVDLSTGVATQIFTGTSIANSGSSLTLSPALAYDSLNGEVYFTQAGILMKMGADGSNPTAVTSSAISSAISGITLDTADNLAFVEDATTANRDVCSVDLATGTVTKIYQNTSFVMGTGLAYNSADGEIYFTQASAVGGPPNLYKIPSNPGSTLSSGTLVASNIEGSSATQITFNQTGDQAFVRGITSGGTTINQVDLTNGTVSTVLSPSGFTGLSVIFAPASTPTLSTTPSPGTVTLGPAPATLTDAAVLSGGSNPTGSITFTLFFNGSNTSVDTESVAVNGNGTYNTPTGFSSPSSGIYQWDASYSGDANNIGASDTNNLSEQVMVVPASPTLGTTPSPATVSLGPTPTTLTDTAILSGGSNPTGSITFTLVGPGSVTVDTETVSVSGNGTYSTPTGFTMPGNSMSIGTYQWDATYSGDTNNNITSDTNNPAEQVTVIGPVLSTAPSPTRVTLGRAPLPLTDAATLAGGANPTGSITFTLFYNGGITPVDTEVVAINGDGTYSTPTGFTLPSGAATGTYQWDATYSGDVNNIAASDVGNPTEVVTVSPALPALSTSPSPATVSLGATPTTLNDTAVLAGGFNPTGTITFTVFHNGSSTPVDIETVTVSGNGTYSTPTGLTLPFSRAASGTYQWDATYSGDTNNNAISDVNNPAEQVTVNLPRVTPDNFSGSGLSGVLWRQGTTEIFVQWSMNGPVVTGSQINTYLGTPIQPDASWNELGTADFNGDGKTDILWQHNDGALAIWSMNGSVITNGGFVTSQGQTVHVGPSWSLAGTGDFNGDGTADMLWRNSNGSLAEWLMNGTTVTSSQAPTFQGQTVSPDASWSVVSMGDFNGDGHQDILWRNTNGSLQEWLMNGSQITSSQAPTSQGSTVSPDSSWSVIAAGDFNGDGMTDLLWRQSGTGSLMDWQVNGSQITSSQAVTLQGKPLTTPDASWSLVEIGDFNGDGKSDALWRQSTTGTLSEWLMNGSQVTSASTVTSQSVNPMLDASWQVQSKPTNFA